MWPGVRNRLKLGGPELSLLLWVGVEVMAMGEGGRVAFTIYCLPRLRKDDLTLQKVLRVGTHECIFNNIRLHCSWGENLADLHLDRAWESLHVQHKRLCWNMGIVNSHPKLEDISVFFYILCWGLGELRFGQQDLGVSANTWKFTPDQLKSAVFGEKSLTQYWPT